MVKGGDQGAQMGSREKEDTPSKRGGDKERAPHNRERKNQGWGYRHNRDEGHEEGKRKGG